jgi:ABC-type multidrug transport system fused ATPase/permease subunit
MDIESEINAMDK